MKVDGVDIMFHFLFDNQGNNEMTMTMTPEPEGAKLERTRRLILR